MNKLTVSDFVKLTGTTLKTVNYYHKIGLLPEPERTAAGYRLYGSVELHRMRLIKHLKSLGLDLKHIKDMLGDVKDPGSSREVLQSLRRELLHDLKTLEERVAKIDAMLVAEASFLDEDILDSPSLQATAEILGAETVAAYAQACPEMYAQHRKLHGILDDFKWGEDYQQTLGDLAQFFKEHPREYQISLDYAQRLGRISDLEEDNPEIDVLAREAAQLIKSMPVLKQVLLKQKPIQEPWQGVYNELVADVLSPARIRFNKLLQNYLGIEGNPGSTD
ncbi:MAG: MerR family transcriptional regulator [Syntrophomonadaceae bacterium]|nr:MerR family transcriptional regulator [Syntrophomonadaceae bacterium]